MLYNKHTEIGKSVKNLGFDYSNKILKKSLSGALYRNYAVASFLDLLEPIITDLVNSVKHIKKSFSYTHDKNSNELN